jgi:hypothetical protein
MHPVRYAVRNASTNNEVFERLTDFLQYLRSAHIDCILPHYFEALSARNANDIRNALAMLHQETCHADDLTVAGDLWLADVREAFAAAVERLATLDLKPQANRLANVPK